MSPGLGGWSHSLIVDPSGVVACLSQGVVDFLSAHLSMLGCAPPLVMCVIGSLGFFYFLLSDGMSLTVSLKNVCFSQLHSISFI